MRSVMAPRSRRQSASCVTITSLTALRERKLRRRRPLGSVLKSRVSTDSAGATTREWIRPVLVSTTKSSRTPSTWPSSVMTVFPENSVANRFMRAAVRILRRLFLPSGRSQAGERRREGFAPGSRSAGRGRLLAGRRLSGPSAPTEPIAEHLLDLRGVADLLNLEGVVPGIDDDRPDLQDPLAEALVEVHALELRVGDHLRVLAQDPILADHLVIRDDVARRFALELRREEGQESEEHEQPGEDRAQIDASEVGVRKGRSEAPRQLQTEDGREDQGDEHGRPIAERNQSRRSGHKKGLLAGGHGRRPQDSSRGTDKTVSTPISILRVGAATRAGKA